jgi:hypothetical protein
MSVLLTRLTLSAGTAVTVLAGVLLWFADRQ